ncbi:Piso0_000303 [Millerozyma farinosa CBS 7064]|uniref:Piso0_000303 protein n=1 Tax=Pichia sorbitophila (strain ATCC MYA-4447 / BCRC 22081 / CBS 7064 / NBRC 10061 / NRRL Y-12695) TaxID=559304 RepID=G8YTM1_PICSO|nr:Piso0_000303 [Millerozyma farinosa CBS 7064]
MTEKSKSQSSKEDNYDFQRRPNPKGWTPPKAPYNPYDPTDLRPPEGYPSEYQIPREQPSGFSSKPKEPTQYKKVNETMRKLNYTPRPVSELYPGQYKVLRKVDTYKRFNIGNRWFGTFLGSTIVIYFAFFHRWNDGAENVMSDFYRARLRVQEKLFGLSEQEYEDLYHPKGIKFAVKNVRDADYIPESLRKTVEGEFALNRPSERHVLEAERIQQAQEEEYLKNLDSSPSNPKDSMKTENRKKWFGIF